ncbi:MULTISPECIES: hypothetical protein [Streptomyces]|uniref:hypothetical protein n=1 Tax=Streptomyces TaxID=1883 RepID=UPI001F1138E4|nr:MULTISPECIES: hypothetical protein [Streptomyces]MDH6225736.1 hypothetical protein [Streptomyces sp. MJP52]
MPTPYGSRGMAFGPQELRVLRRALALALHPRPASPQEVQDCLRLADAVDEVTREAARQRAFLLADLVRYRAALPGTVTGYLHLLREALDAGHRPEPEDLAALRALRGNPAAAALLRRCDVPAERTAAPVAVPVLPAQGSEPATAARPELVPVPATASVPPGRRPRSEEAELFGHPARGVPAARTRLLALRGGLGADGGENEPERPDPSPPTDPRRPAQPSPGRPVPTPGEVFPRRKPSAQPSSPSSPPDEPSRGRLAAG